MKKFNKTLAIALAAGVSLGGFHVPVAGATAGYSNTITWSLSDSDNPADADLTAQEDPRHQTPTWGIPREGAGIFEKVLTGEGLVDGFSGVQMGLTAGDVIANPEDPYGTSVQLKDMKTSNPGKYPIRNLSMDSKKMLRAACW